MTLRQMGYPTPVNARLGALIFAVVSLLFSARLQAHAVERPQPSAWPELPELSERRMKFSGPTFEAIRVEGLLGPRAATVELPAALRPIGTIAAELQAEFVGYVRRFEEEQAAKAGVLHRIGTAATLLSAAQVGEAIDALLRIEAEHPGLYQTAAHLAAAYEASGDLERTVVWIANAVERHPRPEEGTEWLQFGIVRAKLRLRQDANWLDGHTVLDGIATEDPGELLPAIERQIEQRVRYTQPTDAILCDLFFQAAVRVSGRNRVTRRAHYLRESLRFGDWRKAEISVLLRQEELPR